MNRLLLLVTFCFFGFVRINAQAGVYHSFPVADGYWQYKHTNSLNPGIHTQTRLGINGDTIINTLTYHKVYSLFDSTLNSPWSTYYGCFREQNKQVFAKFGNNAETLLYDFNLAIGDTIRYTYSLATNNPDTFKNVLTKIDSVILKDGKYRMRYIYDGVFPANASFADTVVEGLGEIYYHGLFEPLVSAYCTCGDNYQITCIKTNDTTRVLRNPDCDHCFCTFLTPVSDNRDHAGKISPNPFNEKTTLSFPRNLNNATLTIFDASGRQMRIMKNINEQTVSVSRNELPAGIYLIELKEGNTILANEKIAVVD
ncbi:MAG: T9SS type A sorting domain-containing protein [Bacteroidia bacterium]